MLVIDTYLNVFRFARTTSAEGVVLIVLVNLFAKQFIGGHDVCDLIASATILPVFLGGGGVNST